MKVLFVNNKDSFVWNLVDYVSIFEPDTFIVPNTISMSEVHDINPDAIIISPGPGSPHKSADIGSCIDIICEFGKKTPIFGVCLGHQAINVAFRGTINHTKGGPIHGKACNITHESSPLFSGIKSTFTAGRYHSLAIDRLGSNLKVTSKTDNIVMSIEHMHYPIYGVQFHPESILTYNGIKIIENFINIANKHKY